MLYSQHQCRSNLSKLISRLLPKKLKKKMLPHFILNRIMASTMATLQKLSNMTKAKGVLPLGLERHFKMAAEYRNIFEHIHSRLDDNESMEYVIFYSMCCWFIVLKLSAHCSYLIQDIVHRIYSNEVIDGIELSSTLNEDSERKANGLILYFGILLLHVDQLDGRM